MGSQLKDSVISFFKIMIDHDFHTLLYLPPKFTRVTPGLLNKKTYLENLNGRRWNVVVSEEKGRLVIRKGWLDFAKAHNLGVGDFVVFHYFLGNYFLVQVFNKSACDLRGAALGDGYASKRNRAETNLVVLDTDVSIQVSGERPDSKADSNNLVILSSEKETVNACENKNVTEVHPLDIVPVENKKAEPTNFEDPELQLLMRGSYTFYDQREDRTVIDLSDYEMPIVASENKSNTQATENTKGFTIVAKCKVEQDSAEFSNPDEEIKCEVGFFKTPKRKEVEGSLYSVAKKTKFNASTIGFSSSASLSSEIESGVKNTNHEVLNIGSLSSASLSTKKESVVTKDDAQSIKSPVVKIKKEVKTEPFVETDLALETASASDLHCLITNPTLMDLELPGSLPLYTTRRGTSYEELIILHDSAGKVWPVYYHHKPNRKRLTSGWQSFVEYNHIQAGDECIFKVGTKDAAYNVSIVRKNDRLT